MRLVATRVANQSEVMQPSALIAGRLSRHGGGAAAARSNSHAYQLAKSLAARSRTGDTRRPLLLVMMGSGPLIRLRGGGGRELSIGKSIAETPAPQTPTWISILGLMLAGGASNGRLGSPGRRSATSPSSTWNRFDSAHAEVGSSIARLVEAKRIRAPAEFGLDQLAKSLAVAVAQAGTRRPLLLVVMGSGPAIRLRGGGGANSASKTRSRNTCPASPQTRISISTLS